MRKFLIVLQAAILSTIAVYGAIASAEGDTHCPLPQPKAAQTCNFAD